MTIHKPVLLNEVMEILEPKPGEFFIDGTFGSGGHSAEILKKISPNGILLGVDWDDKNIANCKEQMVNRNNAICIQGNYAELPEILKKNNLPKADGLLIDLGFSSEQLESSGRGFSFLNPPTGGEPLDMRYSTDTELTAAEVINGMSEKDLADIFYKYGEERFSRKIAKKIVEERRKEKILTSGRLAEVVKMAVGKSYEKGRIHPATRVFQALRIYVNKELENVERLLKNLPEIIAPGGRIAVISFHSLEDRIVKNQFREFKKQGIAELVNKKPITASREEIAGNPRSRSAKLRGIKIVTSH